MAVPSPILDLLYLDSHSAQYIALADVSIYPSSTFNIVSPTITIAIPNGQYVVLPFTPRNVNIFDSTDLGITCDESINLPDGIYSFTYSIGTVPFAYSVVRTFLRTDIIQEKFDSAFLKLDLTNSIETAKKEDKAYLENVNISIQEAIAAVNKGAFEVGTRMYMNASKALDTFLKEGSCLRRY